MNFQDVALPTIALTQVTTAGAQALNGVTLSVQPGEILTLLGDDASTVLEVIAGFKTPRAGEVVSVGRSITRLPPHRRKFGMVSRELDLFVHLDVLGHAKFAHGVTGKAAMTMLSRLGLAEFAKRKPQTLSSELQLRVALARALARKPTVLLLNDPFANLSLDAADSLKTWLRSEVAETGLCIVHCTTDASASYGFADRIGVLDTGALRQIGTAQALYDQPESLAVARMMGAINQLPGTVIALEDDIALVSLSGGAVVEGRSVDELQVGAACILAIRPERIAIAAMNPTDLGEGALAATMIEAVFAGDHMRLTLRADLRQGKSLELLVIRPSLAILPRNGNISLAWQSHHAHVFAGGAA